MPLRTQVTPGVLLTIQNMFWESEAACGAFGKSGAMARVICSVWARLRKVASCLKTRRRVKNSGI